nr:MAG TPA: hypothetical protein [Caudoviricetes sp.]
MKPEYIAYGLCAYYLIGFLLWLWAIVDDAMTGNRHRGGLIVTLETLVAMLLGWPFLVADLIKPRRRK